VQVVQVAQARGESLEAAARDARYAALAGALGEGEFLLTAHNEDDQLETVLLQLLRGAGLPGLAAMPESAPFAGGALLRPLLGVSRDLLRQYLERSGVPWIEDPSNADERFDRNYLRRRIVPVLRARWPSVGLTASRSARHAAEAQSLLTAAAEGLLDAALDGETLKLTVLRRLTMAERRLALRQWIVRRGFTLPEQRRLDEIAGRLVHARADAQPLLRWQGCELRCHAGRLHIASIRAEPVRESLEWPWSRQRRILLPGGGSLALVAERFGDIATDRLPPSLQIRFREGGERLGERFGRRTLKDLLQHHHLPPWQRAQLPLVGTKDEVLAIPGLWVAPTLMATAADKRRARLRWLPVDEDQRVASRGRQRWHPPP
jgi:tRNA(Ile)-lysidine synthase